MSNEDSEVIFKLPLPRQPDPKTGWISTVFFIFGMYTAIPWNLFIASSKYFEADNPENMLQLMITVSLMPNLAVAVWLACAPVKVVIVFVQIQRIFFGLFMQLIAIIFLLGFIQYTKTNGPALFYFILIYALTVNCGVAIFNSSTLGLAMMLPPKPMMIFCVGAVTGQQLTALVTRMVVDEFKLERISGMFVYFLTVSTVIILCICLIRTVDTGGFRDSVRRRQQTELVTKVFADENKAFTFLHYVNLFAVMFSIVCVYREIFPNVQPNKSGGVIFQSFTGKTIVMVFNVFAMIGSIVAIFKQIANQYVISAAVIIKIAIVPLFFMCNYKPDTRQYGVVIESNEIYITLVCIHAFMSGYLSSVCLWKISQSEVSGVRRARAGRISSAIIAVAFVMGITCSYGAKKLIVK